MRAFAEVFTLYYGIQDMYLAYMYGYLVVVEFDHNVQMVPSLSLTSREVPSVRVQVYL